MGVNRKLNHNVLWCIAPVLVMVVLFLIGFVSVAFAAEGHTHSGAVGKFYKSWMMPDSPNSSCCNEGDCSPVASRFVNGKWEAQREGGQWVTVPPNKIETQRESPDARSHLCGRPVVGGLNAEFSVFCFVGGNGT